MTQSLITVPLVTLLFQLSTTLIVHLLPVVVVRSILLFSSFSSTVFAAHGFTVTGIVIGSIPGILIVIVSFPALKLGYSVIFNWPLVMTKLFVWVKYACFFVILLFVIDFSFMLHGISIPCLLVIFATVSSALPFLSLTVITKLGIFSGLICGIPSVSEY